MFRSEGEAHVDDGVKGTSVQDLLGILTAVVVKFRVVKGGPRQPSTHGLHVHSAVKCLNSCYFSCISVYKR